MAGWRGLACHPLQPPLSSGLERGSLRRASLPLFLCPGAHRNFVPGRDAPGSPTSATAPITAARLKDSADRRAVGVMTSAGKTCAVQFFQESRFVESVRRRTAQLWRRKWITSCRRPKAEATAAPIFNRYAEAVTRPRITPTWPQRKTGRVQENKNVRRPAALRPGRWPRALPILR